MSDELKRFKEELNRAGLKATPQRLAILQILSDFELHPCADTIYDEIKASLPGISRATVYSTLRSLCDAKLVQEVGGLGAIRRFDGNSSPHAHIMCVKCNKVTHIAPLKPEIHEKISEIADYAEEETGYAVINDLLTMYGYCPECTTE